MPDYGGNIRRAGKSVRTWPLDFHASQSKLTPDLLRESADDMEKGPDTPYARRLIARIMDNRGIPSATPSEIKEIWKNIPDA